MILPDELGRVGDFVASVGLLTETKFLVVAMRKDELKDQGTPMVAWLVTADGPWSVALEDIAKQLEAEQRGEKIPIVKMSTL